jgi:hypothetical protein
MNIWTDINNKNKAEDILQSTMNEELQNCFARMRVLENANIAEAASQTDLENNQPNDN